MALHITQMHMFCNLYQEYPDILWQMDRIAALLREGSTRDMAVYSCHWWLQGAVKEEHQQAVQAKLEQFADAVIFMDKKTEYWKGERCP